jgi:hypothetical protein
MAFRLEGQRRLPTHHGCFRGSITRPAHSPSYASPCRSPYTAQGLGFPGGELLPGQDLFDSSLPTPLAHLLPSVGFHRRLPLRSRPTTRCPTPATASGGEDPGAYTTSMKREWERESGTVGSPSPGVLGAPPPVVPSDGRVQGARPLRSQRPPAPPAPRASRAHRKYRRPPSRAARSPRGTPAPSAPPPLKQPPRDTHRPPC